MRVHKIPWYDVLEYSVRKFYSTAVSSLHHWCEEARTGTCISFCISVDFCAPARSAPGRSCRQLKHQVEELNYKAVQGSRAVGSYVPIPYLYLPIAGSRVTTNDSAPQIFFGSPVALRRARILCRHAANQEHKKAVFSIGNQRETRKVPTVAGSLFLSLSRVCVCRK